MDDNRSSERLTRLCTTLGKLRTLNLHQQLVNLFLHGSTTDSQDSCVVSLPRGDASALPMPFSTSVNDGNRIESCVTAFGQLCVSKSSSQWAFVRIFGTDLVLLNRRKRKDSNCSAKATDVLRQARSDSLSFRHGPHFLQTQLCDLKRVECVEIVPE